MSLRTVVYIVNVRSREEVERALALCRTGLTTSEVARLTGIPRATVRDWRQGRQPRSPASNCPFHDASHLDERRYAYLLGIYLGDGCISARPRGVWHLRITLDASYPEIAAGCPERHWLGADELVDYWRTISYELTAAHLEGARCFFRHAFEMGLIPTLPELRFFDPEAQDRHDYVQRKSA